MAKAIAVIADVNPHEEDKTKFRVTLAVTVKPDAGQTFEPFKMESMIYTTGIENANQLTTMIYAKVKADSLAQQNVTLTDSDITTTKFT